MKKILTIAIIIAMLIVPSVKADEYKQKIAEVEIKQNELHVIAEYIRDLKLDNEEEIIKGLQYAWHELDDYKDVLLKKQARLNSMIYLGVFDSSAYCGENYYHTCNNGNSNSTATGTVPTAGRTIAVDPKVIPLGATVIIGGNEYIAEDTGGAIKGKKVDIFFDTHVEAIQYGRRKVDVYIIKP